MKMINCIHKWKLAKADSCDVTLFCEKCAEIITESTFNAEGEFKTLSQINRNVKK